MLQVKISVKVLLSAAHKFHTVYSLCQDPFFCAVQYQNVKVEQ